MELENLKKIFSKTVCLQKFIDKCFSKFQNKVFESKPKVTTVPKNEFGIALTF